MSAPVSFIEWRWSKDCRLKSIAYARSMYDIVLCVYERFPGDGWKRYVNDDRLRVDGDKNMRLLAFALTFVVVWTGSQPLVWKFGWRTTKIFYEVRSLLGSSAASYKCNKSKRFFFKIRRLGKDYQIAQCLNWSACRKNTYQSFQVRSEKFNSSDLLRHIKLTFWSN